MNVSELIEFPRREVSDRRALSSFWRSQKLDTSFKILPYEGSYSDVFRGLSPLHCHLLSPTEADPQQAIYPWLPVALPDLIFTVSKVFCFKKHFKIIIQILVNFKVEEIIR